jgi:phenylpyruvate tautomerase PptA (4-oxalocrotonate tautomerase family)
MSAESRRPTKYFPRLPGPPARRHHRGTFATSKIDSMPLVRIDLLEGRSVQFLTLLSQTIHTTMISQLSVLERDYFQIITEHKPYQLLFSRDYLDVNRSDKHIFIHMFLSAGRSGEVKETFFKALNENLMRINAEGEESIRREDISVILTETKKEDWSFGNGLSYLTIPKEQWK